MKTIKQNNLKIAYFLKTRTVWFVLFMFLLNVNAPFLEASDQFLDACLKIAESRDKKLAVSREQVSLSKMRVTKSARGFFPAVQAQKKHATGRTLNQTESYQSDAFGIKASQTIFEGGRTRASYKYDTLMVEASKFNYTKTREELFYKIKTAYYEVLSLRTEYAYLDKAFTEIDRLSEKVKIEYKSKAISELELMEAINFRDKVENLLRSSEANLNLSNQRLIALIDVEGLDNIPVMMPEGIPETPPELSFTLEECLALIPVNNLDIKLARLQTRMNEMKRTVARSKVVPKFYIDGYYGRSGEAYVNEPLDLTTVWTLTGKMSWSLWGNSLEVAQTDENTTPRDIVDVSNKVSSSSLDITFALLDDLTYFVDAKESKVNYNQSRADYDDILKKAKFDFRKTYNDYESTLKTARTLKNEINTKKRKLELMKKRNDLYEVPTVQLMEETWRFSETISQYAKAIITNYIAVTDMERLTLISLR